jgi:hypothetical protein
MRIVVVVPLAIVIIGVLIIFYLRRDLPYNFDIIRTEHGVAVINVDSWVSRELNIKIEQNGRILADGVIDPQTHCGLIEEIGTPGPSHLLISRKDLFGRLIYKSKKMSVVLNGRPQEYIILIGASIGHEWNLPGFPDRINNDKFVLSDRVKYEFDKSDLIESVMKYKIKPKAVIIKECSAYFPRNIENSIEYKRKWVNQLRGNEIIPIIATTTPVARRPQNRDQQSSIDEWNHSIREAAEKEQYHVLDLALALQTDTIDTYLKPGYFVDDGLHMTALAYNEAFDVSLKNLLDGIFNE